MEAAGARLVEAVQPGDVIHHLYTRTVRSYQTADLLHTALRAALGEQTEMHEPRREWAIRNPDLFLCGHRVEMVSTPEAMAHQIRESGITPEDVDRVEFFHSFFRAPDRIRYCLEHAGAPG